MTADKPASEGYLPMTPQERAQKHAVSLTQRMKLNLRDNVPNKFITLEEAKAYDDSWCYDPKLGECRYGHQAARRVANVQICSDCERVKAGEAPIYGKSRANKHYPEPRRKPKSDASAPVVIQAPPAPPAAPELPKREMEFLAALEETRDFDKASAASSWPIGLVHARAASNEPFRKALTLLCERRGIAQKRAPDSTFTWTKEIERNLVNRFVDTGFLETARNECGVTASEFFSHVEQSPEFAAAIEEARPKAREVLRDLATRSAALGKVELLKFLETDEPANDISQMSHHQMNAEIERLLARFDKMGLFPTERQHKVTGERIDLNDYEYVKPDNSDLVGGE